jgi:hypothetical protein
LEAVEDVVRGFDIELPGEKCWRLFRALQFAVPAAVAASGKSVSLYGVGSFKAVSLKSGKKRMKAYYSDSVSGVLSCKGVDGSFMERFRWFFGKFAEGNGGDSLLEAYPHFMVG